MEIDSDTLEKIERPGNNSILGCAPVNLEIGKELSLRNSSIPESQQKGQILSDRIMILKRLSCPQGFVH